MSDIKFDSNFQLKVLGNAVKDVSFFLRIIDTLPSDFFENEAHRWIYDFLKTYFLEYKELPSFEVIIIANEHLNTPMINGRENILFQLINITIKQLTDVQVDQYIQRVSKDFCIEQTYIKVIEQCISHIQNKKYDLIPLEIEQAQLNLRRGETISYNYFDSTNIKNRLIETFQDRTSTGWPLIDQNTKMGLANGELGIVMAPTGVGKSFFLVNIAYGALKQRKNVVYMTLELSKEDISNRMDAIIAETSLNELYAKAEMVESKIVDNTDYLGQFHIVEFNKKPTLNDIKLKLIQLKNHLNIDTVIIDYAGVIKVNKKSSQKRWDLEEIFEDLVFLAKEFNVKMWTASQSNRVSISTDVIDLTHVSEAYSIAFPSTLFLTFSRTPDEAANNAGKFHIVKNRLGKTLLLFEIAFKNEMSRIHVTRLLDTIQLKQEFTEEEKQNINRLMSKIRKD